MDPLLPADTELMEREADKDARRKIQFSVPSSVPTQLDPRQVEMVRKGVWCVSYMDDDDDDDDDDSGGVCVWRNEFKLGSYTKCFVSFLCSLKPNIL